MTGTGITHRPDLSQKRTMSTSAPSPALVAPVVPTPSHVQWQPLSVTDVRLGTGPWADWQQDNRDVSLPHGQAWIERDGVVDNFRRLVDPAVTAERRGWVFCDTDLYKLLEAAAWDLARGAHDESEAFLARSAELLRRVQEPDGYLNTYVQAGLEERYGNLARGHELYGAGHLVQAALAEVRATGRQTLMDVARPFADHLVTEFLDGGRDDTDGHPQIEMALVELYRQTGERRYLDLARQLLDVRGHGVLGPGLFGSTYFQDDIPVREQRDVVGHAVRALYLLCGIVDVAVEDQDVELLDVAESQWESMLSGKTYLTGAVGSRFEGEAFGDRYELPPDLVYGETCASIAAFMASWRLLLATGKGRYADLMERVLHNVLAGSTALTRDRFFYVNPMHRRRPQRAVPAGEKPVRTDAPGERAEWFDVACCPPNVMRTIATLPGYVATRSADGVQVHQYLPATIDTAVADGPVRLAVETDYPRTGTVRVRVLDAPGSRWTLRLRIPGWAGTAHVRTTAADGRDLAAREPASPAGGADGPTADTAGYAVLEATWGTGDEVVLDLPVTPRLTVPHPAVDAVRGCVAVERGPVVYCVERPADDDGIDLDRFELLADAALTERWDATLLGGTQVIVLEGVVRDETSWDGTAWAPADVVPPLTRAPARLEAIPYALWANRGPSQMRVWLPVAPAGGGAR